ncbi:hypothetical protein G9464_16210 [Halostella sp. JP-L12]|uniref:hypothetical protein n=1 Tax=Halostella TaxID=1843185 RepID=UPI000EF84A7E|nr:MULTISPECIES: hypothetical protein [Halostella]NHN49124.1 hypothetical protein [Halostella sp. JP-L12]
MLSQLCSAATASLFGVATPTYLLGFPTPVVEIYLLLAAVVVGFALYFGLSFEDVDVSDEVPVEDRETDEERMGEIGG